MTIISYHPDINAIVNGLMPALSAFPNGRDDPADSPDAVGPVILQTSVLPAANPVQAQAELAASVGLVSVAPVAQILTLDGVDTTSVDLSAAVEPDGADPGAYLNALLSDLAAADGLD